MARLIANEGEIENLKEINGLTLKQIETRSIPINDNTEDPSEWKYRSFDGFLGDGESFKERLKEDWKTVVDVIGLNHVEFAECIIDILNKVEQERERESKGPMSTIFIDYSVPKRLRAAQERINNNNNSKEIELLAVEGYSFIKLEVRRQLFSGSQYSLFFNEKIVGSIHNTRWNEEYTICNTENKLKVKIAGGLKGGVVQYINDFGFYEGGENNSYRVDPLILLSVISGKKVGENTLRIVKNREQQTRISPLTKEIDSLRKRAIAPEVSEEEKAWINNRIKTLEKDIETTFLEVDQFINEIPKIK